MRRPVLLLGLAMTLAIVTGMLILRYLSAQRTAVASAPTPVVKVVVAAAEIPLGKPVQEQHIQLVDWPKEHVPPGSASDPAQVLGKRARVRIPKGFVIVPSEHLGEAESGPIAMIIPEGRRAVSVRVNDVTSISGFVMPGSRVDVVATLRRPGSSREARILLQNVPVLAVAQETQPRDEALPKANTVTLLVTPAEAEQLTLATTEGQIQLALRGYDDDIVTPTSGVSLEALLDGLTVAQPTPLSPDAIVASAYEVEVIRGTERVIQRF